MFIFCGKSSVPGWKMPYFETMCTTLKKNRSQKKNSQHYPSFIEVHDAFTDGAIGSYQHRAWFSHLFVQLILVVCPFIFDLCFEESV